MLPPVFDVTHFYGTAKYMYISSITVSAPSSELGQSLRRNQEHSTVVWYSIIGRSKHILYCFLLNCPFYIRFQRLISLGAADMSQISKS
jgi:hypothetical protein